jgi:hypothetical protein
MNVRIVPRRAPNRTLLYGGVDRVESDGERLFVRRTVREPKWWAELPLRAVAEILIDEHPGDW